jgi:serine protease inhibitor
VNATYFEGGWQDRFSKVGSRNFSLVNGQVKQVPMISARSHFAYSENEAREVIEIPFHGQAGKNYSFLVIAPKAGTDFNALQAGELWQSQYWQNAEASLQNGELACTVALPELNFNFSVDLNKVSPLTKALGLEFLFAENADLSNMATKDSPASQVSLIRQQSRIELDENGVKAAAVTFVGGVGGAAPHHPPVVCADMKIDRPFAFAIMDRATNAFLFVGSVIEP